MVWQELFCRPQQQQHFWQWSDRTEGRVFKCHLALRDKHTHGLRDNGLYLGCDVITMMSARTSDSSINTIRSPPATKLIVCANPSVFQRWQIAVNDCRCDTWAVCLSVFPLDSSHLSCDTLRTPLIMTSIFHFLHVWGASSRCMSVLIGNFSLNILTCLYATVIIESLEIHRQTNKHCIKKQTYGETNR